MSDGIFSSSLIPDIPGAGSIRPASLTHDCTDVRHRFLISRAIYAVDLSQAKIRPVPAAENNEQFKNSGVRRADLKVKYLRRNAAAVFSDESPEEAILV